ncbi:DUF4249 family protein [candidate division KSB1 bacterium]|nr:DUF4249 family protein [candidate division KSB1 bacterium]
MKTKSIIIILILSAIWISCDRELNITDFKDEFGNYKPELKIEGLLQQDKPEDSIIRIIKTSAITDTTVYNGKDDDHDGDIDEYDEILPLIQDTTATVKVINLNSGAETKFEYVADASSFISWGDDEEEYAEGLVVPYGAYKPASGEFHLEEYAKYKLEVYSKEFDKTITGITTVYPAVEFIDTLYTFQENQVTIKINQNKELFWKSDKNVTAYYVTYELVSKFNGDEPVTEFLYSYKSARDNEINKNYKNVSIGHEQIWDVDYGVTFKITVQGLSPEYGRYMFSSLPLNDHKKSNLRDEHGNPVMGCFGAAAARSIFVVIEE